MAEAKNEDDVLEILQGLAGDAASAYESFKKKATAGLLGDINALLVEVGELFSIQADLAQYTFRAHTEHFEWAEGVDNDLDELKEGLGGSVLLPDDATKLKETILALKGNLRQATDPSDDVPAILAARADEAIAFIDEVTAEEGDDEDEEEDDETES